MHRGEVGVTIVGVLVGGHLVGWAFKAHACLAPGTLYLETPIYSHHRHPARLFSTEAPSRLIHVFLEIFVRLPNLDYVLTLDPFMLGFLLR
jgi:hypothetical protein